MAALSSPRAGLEEGSTPTPGLEDGKDGSIPGWMGGGLAGIPAVGLEDGSSLPISGSDNGSSIPALGMEDEGLVDGSSLSA